MEHNELLSTSKWYALFSQTGQELGELCRELGRYPDVILSDSTRFGHRLHGIEPNLITTNDGVQKCLIDMLKPGDLVTLHGYLNIIKPAVLSRGAKVWNGHPGLAMIYPELAGRDPQEKFIRYQGKKEYDMIGSIVHEVTMDVDRGPLISMHIRVIPEQLRGRLDAELVYVILRRCSKGAWLKALRGVV